MRAGGAAYVPAGALGERRGGAVDPHAGQAVKPHELDQRANLGLGAPEADRAVLGAEATSEHREIDHQRCVGERKLMEVDDHIRLGANRSRERLAPAALRAAVLVASAPQPRGLVIELDDPGNLYELHDPAQGLQEVFLHFSP
jgi:hypothetical protein